MPEGDRPATGRWGVCAPLLQPRKRPSSSFFLAFAITATGADALGVVTLSEKPY